MSFDYSFAYPITPDRMFILLSIKINKGKFIINDIL